MTNHSFEWHLLPPDTWGRSNVNKTSMCCRRHHVDAMLTLVRRHMVSCLGFIANYYNNFKKWYKNFQTIKIIKLFTFCSAFSSKSLTFWTCWVLCWTSFIFCLLKCTIPYIFNLKQAIYICCLYNVNSLIYKSTDNKNKWIEY